MNKTIVIAIAVVCGALSANADGLKRYNINVKDFHELRVIEGLKVDYVCNDDSAGIATFVTEPELASVLMFTNNKDRLDIQISTDGIDYENLPAITVYSRFLTKVENSGDSLVRVLSLKPTPKFSARLIGNGQLAVHGIDATNIDGNLDTGNGTLFLKGKAKKANLKAVGTGSIQADEMPADEIKCSLLGTGYIGCYPIETLSVKGVNGKVYYKGEPKSIKNHAIGIKTIPIDEKQPETDKKAE